MVFSRDVIALRGKERRMSSGDRCVARDASVESDAIVERQARICTGFQPESQATAATVP